MGSPPKKTEEELTSFSKEISVETTIPGVGGTELLSRRVRVRWTFQSPFFLFTSV